eukprot:scpid58020/ scgid19368/ Dynamin-A
MEIITGVLQGERDKAREIVEAIIDSEQNYLFTNDIDYLQNRTEIVSSDDKDPNNPPRATEENSGRDGNNPRATQQKKGGTNAFVQEIRARIDAYFRIVVRNVRDAVPKSIGYFLVKMSQEKLQFELYSNVNKSPAIADALGEPKHVTEERKTIQKTLEAMKKSIKILQRDPDITGSLFGEDELSADLRKEAANRDNE